MRRSRVVAAAAFLFLTSSAVGQVVPEKVRFQAFITDTEGTPLNGTHTLEIGFWNGPGAEADLLYSETVEVAIEQGVVDVLVGEGSTPLDYGVFATDGTVYLSVAVDGELLDPRAEIAAVPYAMWSANALSEAEIREALGGQLLPPNGEAGDLLRWDDSVGAWVAVSEADLVESVAAEVPAGEPGPTGPSGPQRLAGA